MAVATNSDVGVSISPPAFRTGFILSPRLDLFWFLGLPFLAIAAGLATQQWLPAVALASVNVWINLPHHFATWLRTFGYSEDWRRFKDQLIVGPIVIIGLTIVGIKYAPLTLLLVAYLWDLQHSLMQQHGFSRIYDFKAKAGADSTRYWDLALNWILFPNLVITAPLFTKLWIREFYRFGFPVSAAGLHTFQMVSYSITAIFLCAYVGHVVWSVRRGYSINPIKYAFLGSSYFLWYFVSWQTASLMVFTVSHVLMHGLQYIVMCYYYLRRKAEQDPSQSGFMRMITRRSNIWAFVLLCGCYSAAYQMIVGRPLGDFGFGVINFMTSLPAIPEVAIDKMSQQTGYELFALTILKSLGMVHFYYDSFIWKVRDRKIQKGL